jgi:hypothetical protein
MFVLKRKAIFMVLVLILDQEVAIGVLKRKENLVVIG